MIWENSQDTLWAKFICSLSAGYVCKCMCIFQFFQWFTPIYNIVTDCRKWMMAFLQFHMHLDYSFHFSIDWTVRGGCAVQVTQHSAELNVGEKKLEDWLIVNVSVVMQVSRRLWTCLCGNALYFFNNTKDTHVSKSVQNGSWWVQRHCLNMFVIAHSSKLVIVLINSIPVCLCGTVRGEAGPEWLCFVSGWLWSRQKLGSSTLQFALERWRD